MNETDSLAKIIKQMQRRIELLERRPSGPTMNNIKEELFPVGICIVARTSSYDPTTYLPGTWSSTTYAPVGIIWRRTA